MNELSLAGLVVITLGMAAGTFVKGVTGGGLPLVSVPIIALFLGVEEAVVVMAIPVVITNLWMMWSNRGALPRAKHLPVLVVTSCVGAVVGVVALARLNERWLAGGLALLIIGYLFVRIVGPDASIGEDTDRWLRPIAGTAAGLTQGAMGIASPVLITYLHSLKLDRQLYLLMMTMLISLSSLAQAISLGIAGLYTSGRLVASAFALVPIALLLPIAMRVGRRLSKERFDVIIRLLLAAAAVSLVFDAVTG